MMSLKTGIVETAFNTCTETKKNEGSMLAVSTQ